MTTVISRVYADEATADSVLAALRAAGHPEANIDKFKAGGKNLTAKISAARVAREAASTYARMLKNDTTLVVIRAPFTPFGAARDAMSIADSVDSLPAKVETQNLYIREEPDTQLFIGQKILRKHPLILSSDMNRQANAGRDLVSRAMHWKLLTAHRTRRSATSGTSFMSQKILPFPLLSHKSRRNSAIQGGKRILYNPSPRS